MASLADLFNPTFLIFLGILVLVAALIVVYFESKVRDQNHKIASMLSLVSTLAEDMNGIKLGLNHLAMTSFGGSNRQPFINKKYEEEDDEGENEEDEEEDEEEEKKESKLISVSDDENDSDSESDAGSMLDSVSDSDSDSDTEINDIEELADEINDEEISTHSNIKVLKLNITNDLFENNEVKEELEDLEVLEVLEDNLSDTQSVDLNGELLSAEEKNDENLLTSDLKSININLEESNNETIDYKKLSLTKLRSIVSEKGLSTDSSKLKKQDLLKLLGVE
jgi:cobalamin biosynthesis protein CobT